MRLPLARRQLAALLAALLLALLPALPASAHKASDSYLALAVDASGAISGRWDIALRDLDTVLALDADGDGHITWGELRPRHAEISQLALADLRVHRSGQACVLTVGTQQVAERGDGAYSVLPLSGVCALAANTDPAAAMPAVSIGYRLFAGTDPLHRGLLKLEVAGQPLRTAVLGPDAAEQRFEGGTGGADGGAWAAFATYLWEGVWHIWIGLDHILFLLALLLPAVLAPTAARPPLQRWQEALWDVVRVVTAFTVAHSITLSLAVLGVVSLPSRWVESAIALSVVLAALNNVKPVLMRGRAGMAFAFGLLHGFGFASVLGELGLPARALGVALLSFNVGVEVGQLAIVAVFLPLAWALRRTAFYRRGVLVGGSLLVAALALAWLLERAFDLSVLPF